MKDLRELGAALEVRGCLYCLMANQVHLCHRTGRGNGGDGAPDEGAGGRGHAESQSAGGTLQYVLGGMLQVQPGADRNVPARLCALHRAQPGTCGMVPAAGDYPWSSFLERMGDEEQWIDLDLAYSGHTAKPTPCGLRFTKFVPVFARFRFRSSSFSCFSGP